MEANMNYIKNKWRMLTFIALLASYLIFIVFMNHRVDYLIMTGIIYVVVTTLLFLGTIVGTPGILLHSIFKKEHAAVPFYHLAINLGSTNTNILTAYGLILLRDYKPEEALELFQKAKETTNHFMFHKTLSANIALCHWKMGDIEQAVTEYEDLYYYPDLEAITDFSKENISEGVDKNHNFYVQDFTTMAYLMQLLGQFEKAEYFTYVALEKSKDYAPAYDNLGQLAYEQGNLEQAITFFKQALEYKPDMVDSNFFMAKISVDQEDYQTAKTYLSKIDPENINGLSTVEKSDVLSLLDQVKNKIVV